MPSEVSRLMPDTRPVAGGVVREGPGAGAARTALRRWMDGGVGGGPGPGPGPGPD
jgi:hypothetical protein